VARLERKIFRINEELADLALEEARLREELQFHRHLNDDAQRDAIVSDHPEDRALAYETANDVARFERAASDLAARREKLEAKRDRLLARLGDL
jgi:hypothetical protein